MSEEPAFEPQLYHYKSFSNLKETKSSLNAGMECYADEMLENPIGTLRTTRNKKRSLLRKEMYATQASDNPSLILLECEVCLVTSYKELLLCKSCGFNSCNSCWDDIISSTKECPQCRNKITKKDIVKNIIVERIKDHKEKLESLLGTKLSRKCPSHNLDGNFFCETCSSFVCMQCIPEGNHSGHKIVDIESKPELKAKLREVDELSRNLMKAPRLLQKAQEEHSKSLDLYENQLNLYIKRTKSALLKCLNEFVKPYELEVQRLKNQNIAAKGELNKLEKVAEKIHFESLKIADSSELVKSLEKQLTDENSQIKEVICSENFHSTKNQFSKALSLNPPPSILELSKKLLIRKLMQSL
ncbi:unnamed protein product [Moneuplotes crassus]|uniref:Uncharacterized protein n=1 Tax=Euplotes crassus TaxID=5936 RepID=A0AAD1UNY9_EUPCR|nr:unnamed protein product [Moneuplotes crassus]